MYTLPRELSYYDPVDVKLFEGTSASDLECLVIGGGNLKLHFIVNNKINYNIIIIGQLILFVLLLFY